MTKFSGYCRYKKKNGKEKWGQIEFGISAESSEDCYKKCKSYAGKKNGNAVCVAFAFVTKETENCDLYKDGPYTYANDKSNTTCYIMPKGN